MGRKLKKQRKTHQEEEDNDEIYDEIDRFHQKRNEILDVEQKRPAKQTEVLNVEGDISSDEEEFQQDDDSLFDSDEEKETSLNEALPSADRWGRKRQAYYHTSYVDADFGGMNESDEELAELEREDATRRQKKLDAALQAVRFDDLGDEAIQVAPKKKAIDLEAMSEEQKLQYFLDKNPEFTRMVDEYKEKRELMNTRILPLLKVINALHTERRTVLEQQLRSAVALFSSYLLNLLFYMCLKTTTNLNIDENKKYVDEHPVIDSIISQKKKISTVEEFLNANASALTRILRKVTANKSLSKIIEQSGMVDDVMSRKKNSGVIAMESPTNHFNEPVDDDQIVNEQIEETMESGKRAITSQIEKNKGLSVKRKKGTQHSRVKKRKQFEKAMIKKRSQKPDVRKELKPYAGETRGIRASTIKSIKLKA
uniref:Something about silencing protein 10 n=1 Tax=Ascaris suum TaxID=6253 RepID=F1L308_ASCSU